MLTLYNGEIIKCRHNSIDGAKKYITKYNIPSIPNQRLLIK